MRSRWDLNEMRSRWDEMRWDQITDSKNLEYYMIIGRDIMQSLGINLLFSDHTIQWEGAWVPMHDFNKLKKLTLNKY